MGLALGKQAKMRRQGREAVKRGGRAEHLGAAKIAGLDLEGAELGFEPRAPGDLGEVARLERWRETPRAPAAHDAEMPAMRSRQHFEDHRGLAMGPRAQDDGLIGPLHDQTIVKPPWKLAPRRFPHARRLSYRGNSNPISR